jgi:hypothetical protein
VEGKKLLFATKAVNTNPAVLMVDFAERGDEPVVAPCALAGAVIEDVVNVGRSATSKASEACNPIVVSPLLLCLACGLGLHASVGNPPLIAARSFPLGFEGRAPEHQASGLP